MAGRRIKHKEGEPFICIHHGEIPDHEVYRYPNPKRTPRCRICARIQRQQSKRDKGHTIGGGWIVPGDLVRPFLQERLGKAGGQLSQLSEASGLDASKLARILNGKGNVKFDTLDEMLARMGEVGLARVPLAQGGFAEVYARLDWGP